MLRTCKPDSFKRIIIACGYTDGRIGVQGLASLIRVRFNMDPYEEGTLFLFCGRKKDRFRGIVYDGDGLCLITKYYADGLIHWPMTAEEARELSYDEMMRLITGYTITSTVRKRHPKYTV